jgi:DNA repair protein RadA/Sms
MMFDKYDSMKSLTQKNNVESKKTSFSVRIVALIRKWQGQCNSCKEWNTIAEEIIQNKKKVAWKSETTVTSKAPKPLK